MRPTTKVETLVGEVIFDGTQWIEPVVNGMVLGTPIHVHPEQLDKARQQMEKMVLEAYLSGYYDGEKRTQNRIKDALGML